MYRNDFRLRTSHHIPPKKPKLQPQLSQAEAVQRKQKERERAVLLRQRESDKEQIASIRTCLLRRFGPEAAVPSDESFDFVRQVMQLFDGYLYEAAATALKAFRSEKTGRFKQFKRTFYRYARHLTMLHADADVLYIKQVLRRALDPELRRLQKMIAAYDRQVTDPKAYEALLTNEIDRVLRYDVRTHATDVIRQVEAALIDFADHGKRLSHEKKAERVYVRCRLGSSARTECILALDLHRAGVPSVILGIQSCKEFNRSQRHKLVPAHKGDITDRGQRYANVPKHLRH